MIEKLEACPECGEAGDAWAYDFQTCRDCGYSSMIASDRDYADEIARLKAELEKRGAEAARLATHNAELIVAKAELLDALKVMYRLIFLIRENPDDDGLTVKLGIAIWQAGTIINKHSEEPPEEKSDV